MKYSLKSTKQEKYISFIDINDKTIYLIEDENGKDIKELAERYYQILLWLMNNNSLVEINKKK